MEGRKEGNKNYCLKGNLRSVPLILFKGPFLEEASKLNCQSRFGKLNRRGQIIMSTPEERLFAFRILAFVFTLFSIGFLLYFTPSEDTDARIFLLFLSGFALYSALVYSKEIARPSNKKHVKRPEKYLAPLLFIISGLILLIDLFILFLAWVFQDIPG